MKTVYFYFVSGEVIRKEIAELEMEDLTRDDLYDALTNGEVIDITDTTINFKLITHLTYK